MEFTLEIVNSAAHVICVVNRDLPSDLSELRMRALELVKSHVNLVAFKLGRALTVSLDTVVPPSGGQPEIMDLVNAALGNAVTVYTDIGDFKGIDSIVRGDPVNMRLLDDLIVGFSSPHYATIRCARIVDGIEHTFSSWNKRKSKMEVDARRFDCSMPAASGLGCPSGRSPCCTSG